MPYVPPKHQTNFILPLAIVATAVIGGGAYLYTQSHSEPPPLAAKPPAVAPASTIKPAVAATSTTKPAPAKPDPEVEQLRAKVAALEAAKQPAASPDPLESFKALAGQVGEIAERAGDSGVSYDVEKTSSLVSPYLGVITFERRGNNSTSKFVVHCAFQDGRWIYKNSTIDNPELSVNATYTTETEFYRRIARVFDK